VFSALLLASGVVYGVAAVRSLRGRQFYASAIYLAMGAMLVCGAALVSVIAM
jgi:hypothetical protein